MGCPCKGSDNICVIDLEIPLKDAEVADATVTATAIVPIAKPSITRPANARELVKDVVAEAIALVVPSKRNGPTALFQSTLTITKAQ
ncbi:hypothetical protein EC973_003847 [Apophysomyces ossiformis]|uniref:Uncharacterized protein n=1 Tax=Apophysomyces ossiformis TaxID=679940 RepID=A0A8H7BTF6_9FUNG|nr:hypothetical protein EC973_003847 [Apophysomyces ossiformis]